MTLPSAAAASILALALALAGCFDGPSGDAKKTQQDDSATSDPTAPTPDAPRNDAPSVRWNAGDWWRWEVTGRNFETLEVTTVVAARGADTYSVGVTELDPGLRSQILHVPPVGDIDRSHLGWMAHEHPVEILALPLFDGKTWNGSFEDRPLAFAAHAQTLEGRTVYRVNGSYTDYEGIGPTFVFDPALHQFTEFSLHYGGPTPFATLKLLDHGSGHQGTVHILRTHDKYLGGTGGPTGTLSPTAQFTSPPEKTWLVFGCYFGGGPGHYAIHYVPPVLHEDPISCTHTNDQPTPQSNVQVAWRSSIEGDWSMAFSHAPDGYAEAEVLGVFDTLCELSAPDEAESPDEPCGN